MSSHWYNVCCWCRFEYISFVLGCSGSRENIPHRGCTFAVLYRRATANSPDNSIRGRSNSVSIFDSAYLFILQGQRLRAPLQRGFFEVILCVKTVGLVFCMEYTPKWRKSQSTLCFSLCFWEQVGALRRSDDGKQAKKSPLR